jgi:hypothetical protein
MTTTADEIVAAAERLAVTIRREGAIARGDDTARAEVADAATRATGLIAAAAIRVRRTVAEEAIAR